MGATSGGSFDRIRNMHLVFYIERKLKPVHVFICNQTLNNVGIISGGGGQRLNHATSWNQPNKLMSSERRGAPSL